MGLAEGRDPGERGRHGARDAISGFKTGLAVAASISPYLGFDTHSNHDGAHQPNMLSMLYGIDQVMQELVNAGEDVLVFYNDKASFSHFVSMMRSERNRYGPAPISLLSSYDAPT